jgi:hypothetical protein
MVPIQGSGHVNLGDLIEWAIGRNWSRGWVVFRGLTVFVLATCFTSTFVDLFMAYAHWKTGGVLQDFQHFFPPPSPAPSP